MCENAGAAELQKKLYIFGKALREKRWTEKIKASKSKLCNLYKRNGRDDGAEHLFENSSFFCLPFV